MTLIEEILPFVSLCLYTLVALNPFWKRDEGQANPKVGAQSTPKTTQQERFLPASLAVLPGNGSRVEMCESSRGVLMRGFFLLVFFCIFFVCFCFFNEVFAMLSLIKSKLTEK